jgi:hypothetical protein
MKNILALFLLCLFSLIPVSSVSYAWVMDDFLAEGCKLTFYLSAYSSPFLVKEIDGSTRDTHAWSSDYDCRPFAMSRFSPNVRPFQTYTFSELLSLYVNGFRPFSEAELNLARELEKVLDKHLQFHTLGEVLLSRRNGKVIIKASTGYFHEKEFHGEGMSIAEAFEKAFELPSQTLDSLEQRYFQNYFSKISKLSPANRTLQAIAQLKLLSNFDESLIHFSRATRIDLKDSSALFKSFAQMYHKIVLARVRGKVDPQEKWFFKNLSIPSFQERLASLEKVVPFELIEQAILENQLSKRSQCSIF